MPQHVIDCCYNHHFSFSFFAHFEWSVRQLRRGGRIGEFVSVYLNPEQKAVYIASDGGRVCRPLLVLEEGEGICTCVIQSHEQLLLWTGLHYIAPHHTTPHYTELTLLSNKGGALKLTPEHIQGLSTGEASRSLESLIAGGVIEYVDVNEENNCLVALDESDITRGTVLLLCFLCCDLFCFYSTFFWSDFCDKSFYILICGPLVFFITFV